MASFNLLRPEVNKLVAIMDFHEDAVAFFSERAQAYASASNKVVSEALLDGLLQLLDVLVKLDNIKDMRASMVNDFALYKRCAGAHVAAPCRAALR